MLVIIPTQLERDALERYFTVEHIPSETQIIGKLSVTYYASLTITVATGGLGKTQFAVHTQHLIDAGNWDLVICAGAAGSLVDHLAVGDVIIATETVEHDIRKIGGQPSPRFGSSEKVVELYRTIAEAVRPFAVHFAPIASGDEDVASAERRKDIHARTMARAVAWEGAGAARACRFSNVPFIEIRSVTDSADHPGVVADFKKNVNLAMGNIAVMVIALAKHFHSV